MGLAAEPRSPAVSSNLSLPRNREPLLPWELPLPSILQETLQVLESRCPWSRSPFSLPRTSEHAASTDRAFESQMQRY